MLAIVQILAILAALVHVYIFTLESVRFRDVRVHRGIFAVERDDVEGVRPWAFNQGFYNLFLAIGTFVGAILVRPEPAAGWALIVLGCGSMVAAALVLVATDRRMVKAAASQGTIPALALLASLTQL
ncbi:DUF1304 domain-containing protein [Nocardia takedensis]|uniref:DUF1304 domain-containing protein n=1 Tax=Nocardia takedensis TaxID=259390 RepID=UPI000302271C|nr:DUF1304 domain-containing protein [Nocardia takedensis]